MDQETYDGPTLDRESIKRQVRLECAGVLGGDVTDNVVGAITELCDDDEQATTSHECVRPRAGWEIQPVIVTHQDRVSVPYKGAVLVADSAVMSQPETPATIKSSGISGAWASACALLVLSVFLFDLKTCMGASLVTFGGLFIWEALANISQRILASLATVLILMFGIAGLDLSDQWNLAIYLGMASVTIYVALLTVEEEQNYITEWVVN